MGLTHVPRSTLLALASSSVRDRRNGDSFFVKTGMEGQLGLSGRGRRPRTDRHPTFYPMRDCPCRERTQTTPASLSLSMPCAV